MSGNDEKVDKSSMNKRTAIFISHATPEGNDFTLWLGAKLSAMGYEVWADVLRLRGGDDWARKLEDGLRNKAKKVLLVADSVSVNKQGVRNELQIATDIAKKIGDNEFIIPLRLSNYDAPFLIAHAQYIDFKKSWSDGMAELLEVLEEYGLPRFKKVEEGAGIEVWRDAHLHKARLLERRPEAVISNWLPTNSLPQKIRVFDFRGGVVISAKDNALRNASIPLVPHKRGFIGFASQDEFETSLGINFPLELIAEIELSDFLKSGSCSQEIERTDARRKVVDLIRQALEKYLKSRGLTSTSMANNQLAWWWRKTEASDKQINFSWENGPTGRRQIVGFLPKSSIYWHYGLSFSPYLAPVPHIELTSRVIFSRDGVSPLGKSEHMFRLRRSKTKSWRNPRWRDMMLAFLSNLAKGDNELLIHFGVDVVMAVSLPPMIFEAPVTVREDDVSEEENLELDELDTEAWVDEDENSILEEDDL